MWLYTAEALRRADARAGALGVSGPVLMDHAGRAVADYVRHVAPDARRIVVVCGPGNNGGDGYVAARHLAEAGVDVSVLELIDDPGGDAGEARSAVLATLRPEPATPDVLADRLAHADLAIDALFGTGLSRPPTGSVAGLIRALDAAEVTVVSVDVPSGVRSDLAEPFDPHVRADHTVQLAGAVLASALEPARSAFGRSIVADIGMPPEALDGAASARLLRPEPGAAHFPRRGRDVHKYRVGTVVMLAGSERYAGAAELASRAALRTGAGLVTLVAPARSYGLPSEVVLEPALPADAVARALSLSAARRGAWLVGCGVPADDPRVRSLSAALRDAPEPFVLDAGALDPAHADAIRAHGACVLTPHTGELARVFEGLDGPKGSAEPPDPRIDPVAAAQDAADRFGAVVVLKGPTTVIAAPDGRRWISVAGHPGMASGGTGDVLAGCLGALVAEAAAQGASSADELASIVAAGVLLHGHAGERAAARHGVGLTATDVAEALGAARSSLDSGAD